MLFLDELPPTLFISHSTSCLYIRAGTYFVPTPYLYHSCQIAILYSCIIAFRYCNLLNIIQTKTQTRLLLLIFE